MIQPDLDRWTAMAARALGAPVAAISLADDRGRLCLTSMAGAAGAAAGLPGPLCEHVAARVAPLVVEDAREREHASPGVVAYAGVPLGADGEALGTLCVIEHRPRVWRPQEVELLRDLAETIAGEVLLRRAWADLARSNAVVASHNRVHELIGSGAPLEDILPEIVRSMQGYDHALRGSILLLDAERGTLHHGAAPDLPPEYVAAIDGVAIGADVGSCGRAVTLAREILTEDIETDPCWIPYRKLAREHGLRHCWSFPILTPGGTVLGTLAMYGSEPRMPSEPVRGFLRSAARLSGIAIDRHRAEEQLAHQATHDALTGLPNRVLLFDRLAGALARGRRSGASLAVVVANLDRLKLINDALGHDAGDDVLRELAKRLAGAVRPGDTVARIGGDEFLVFAEDVDAAGASGLASRVVCTLGGPEVAVTASVGVALVGPGEADAREAIRRADLAMRAAKKTGGGRFQLEEGVAPPAEGRRLQVESALRRAVEHGEVRLVAQPIVDLETGEVCACEVLARWHHPELGEVGPDEFIPIAEETGLIAALGEDILRRACAAAAAGLDNGAHRIGVNVSARQLSRPEFVDQVRSALADSGLEPDRLVLEVTETAVLGNEEQTATTLASLRAMGVFLSLDDFGTGFSSLSVLKRHAFDGIKVDREFVDGLPHDEGDRAIVAAIVGMGRALGREVVAEGVETEEQLACVRELGCTRAQGWLLGRPAPLLALERV